MSRQRRQNSPVSLVDDRSLERLCKDSAHLAAERRWKARPLAGSIAEDARNSFLVMAEERAAKSGSGRLE